MANHQFQAGRPRHVSVGIAVRYALHPFSEVFKIRDTAGKPYILIGGQRLDLVSSAVFEVLNSLDLPFAVKN